MVIKAQPTVIWYMDSDELQKPAAKRIYTCAAIREFSSSPVTTSTERVRGRERVATTHLQQNSDFPENFTPKPNLRVRPTAPYRL